MSYHRLPSLFTHTVHRGAGACVDNRQPQGTTHFRSISVRSNKASAHEAASNWGNILDQEARAVVDSSISDKLDAARSLWAEAKNKYAQALTIRKDEYKAAYNWGNTLDNEAKAIAEGHVPDHLQIACRLWQEAAQKYEHALEIKMDFYEAANNWGIVLDEEARVTARCTEAEQLNAARKIWRLAGEKYAQALSIRADLHEAAFNWGNALNSEAQAVMGSKLPDKLSIARHLWHEAGEKYAQTLAIRSNKCEAANNWGIALDNEAQAVVHSDLPGKLEVARKLWREAGQKYAQALSIRADYHEAANNWGLALNFEAQAIVGSDLSDKLLIAHGLWQEAGEKYSRALAIKPDKHEAACNWGAVLDEEARVITASEATDKLHAAHGLWREAGKKYAQALAIKADYHEAADKWGNALVTESHTQSEGKGDIGMSLVWKAQALLERIALLSVQGREEVAYNLACVYALQGDAERCVEQLEISARAGKLPHPSHLESDTDLDTVRPSKEFRHWWQQLTGKRLAVMAG